MSLSGAKFIQRSLTSSEPICSVRVTGHLASSSSSVSLFFPFRVGLDLDLVRDDTSGLGVPGCICARTESPQAEATKTKPESIYVRDDGGEVWG